MSLYLLSKRLSKEDFVATGAWFFFVINLTKLPIYTWHGLIGRRSLAFDAMMVPAVLAGALAGRWLVYRIPQKLFETLVVASPPSQPWSCSNKCVSLVWPPFRKPPHRPSPFAYDRY